MDAPALVEATLGTPARASCVTLDALARRWGCGPDDVDPTLRARAAAIAGGYRVVSDAEHATTVASVLTRLDDPALRRDPPANLAAFELGWGENLERCRAAGPSDATLAPAYVKPLRVMRYGGRLVRPDDPYLCHTLTALTLDHVFGHHLAPHPCIVEAGCGTGRHLRTLAGRFPAKRLVGLDWTAASVAILNLIARREGRAIEGVQFDMLAPPADVALSPGAAVYTVHALEQLGARFEPFLDWLLAQQPAVVAHHEPIVELYDPDYELDHLAIAYHHRREWLRGYWPALERLAARGRIEILVARRLHYGDLYTEGSLIVWRPVHGKAGRA